MRGAPHLGAVFEGARPYCFLATALHGGAASRCGLVLGAAPRGTAAAPLGQNTEELQEAGSTRR